MLGGRRILRGRKMVNKVQPIKKAKKAITKKIKRVPKTKRVRHSLAPPRQKRPK